MSDAVKACSRCRATLPLSEFHADKRASDGKRSWCKACFRESVKSWRQRNPEKVRAMNSAERRGKDVVADYNGRYKSEHRERLNEYQRQLRADDPRRDRARDAVRRALARGRFSRPAKCEKCGASDCRIEASHDDYDRPLAVEWLCVPCHRRKDAAL